MSFASWAGKVTGSLAWRLGHLAFAASTGTLIPRDGVDLSGAVRRGRIPGFPAVPSWVGTAINSMPEVVVHVQSCDVVLPDGKRVDVTKWAAGEYVGHEMLADAWEDVDSGLGRQS